MSRLAITAYRQTGFSLVEMMIALVIGLFISGAVMTTFLHNNQSVVFQQEAVSLQEQGRISMEVMARFLRLAGYQSVELSKGSLSNGLDGDDASADRAHVTVRFQPGATDQFSLRDCLNNTIATGSVSFNQFKINTENELVCDTESADSASFTKDADDGILARNVRQFQVRYGIDLDGDQVPNRFVTRTEQADIDMTEVVAVELCLVLATAGNILDSNQSIRDCAGTAGRFSDRTLKRRISTTVALRNRVGS